jgi:hypothetical protein
LIIVIKSGMLWEVDLGYDGWTDLDKVRDKKKKQ